MNMAINAVGTGLPKEARLKLFPRLGLLHSLGLTDRLAYADDLQQIRTLIETHAPGYRPLIDAAISASAGSTDGASVASGGSLAASFESLAAEREVELCKDAFLRQFCFTPFYAWCKLREQERRNVVWIAECIAQKHKDNIHQYIPLF